ncbi:MAG TPA: 50S ribosomal protein L21, partial [Victivallales bacterium]|nr:50S ribosomal protein L21 [Victivallales bacterium]
MKAIVELGGKQFVVKENDIIEINRIDAKKGEKIKINEVLAIINGNDLKSGNPFVSNAKVEAEVIEHIRGNKIIVFKFKRRKGYKRKQGHRQEL